MMPDESTTPDLVELVRKQVEALDRGDLDGVMSSVAEDAVLDGRVESLEGRASIRDFLPDWFRAFDELDFELEEVSQLGGGVVFAVVIQDGRLVGSPVVFDNARDGSTSVWEARSSALRPTPT